MGDANMEKKWLYSFVITSLVCVFLVATSFNMGLMSSLRDETSFHDSTKVSARAKELDKLPRFAYLVSGSKGDLESLWRTLRALYHPRNQYIVHLDLESPVDERLELASRISNDSMYSKIGNVYMITKANLVTYTGPTMVSNTLHACAIFLKRSADWDWFINLSASDYPLVTQDDLIYTFSTLDRNLNFIDHTSNLGWKRKYRGKPIIVDPGLYMLNKSNILWVTTPDRSLPTAFKLFTNQLGWLYRVHSWNISYGVGTIYQELYSCITPISFLLLNFTSIVICNVPEFSNTTVNTDLHYIAWHNPPKQHPRWLSLTDMGPMIASGSTFARKFRRNDKALDKIDKELLMRTNESSFTPGGWCGGKPDCSVVNDVARISPGSGAERLKGLVNRLIADAKSGKNQCE